MTSKQLFIWVDDGIFDIFGPAPKRFSVAETTLKGHSRLSEMTRFD